MTIQLDLSVDVERGLLAQARQHGMSLQDYVQQIVIREAHLMPSILATRTASNLVELSNRSGGLLTDEELDTLFHRNPSTGRPLNLAKELSIFRKRTFCRYYLLNPLFCVS